MHPEWPALVQVLPDSGVDISVANVTLLEDLMSTLTICYHLASHHAKSISKLPAVLPLGRALDVKGTLLSWKAVEGSCPLTPATRSFTTSLPSWPALN